MQVTLKSEPVLADPIIESTPPNQMISNLIGLDTRDLSQKDLGDMKSIEEYLKSQSDDEFKQAQILRDIKFRLGTPEIGQTQLGNLARYIQLIQASKMNEQLAKDLER